MRVNFLEAVVALSMLEIGSERLLVTKTCAWSRASVLRRASIRSYAGRYSVCASLRAACKTLATKAGFDGLKRMNRLWLVQKQSSKLWPCATSQVCETSPSSPVASDKTMV